MSQTLEQQSYTVLGMSCGHCRAAITGEIEKVDGVTAVDVDLNAHRVTVTSARLADVAVRAAIGEAGYDVA